jgi:hypothetical protein
MQTAVRTANRFQLQVPMDEGPTVFQTSPSEFPVITRRACCRHYAQDKMQGKLATTAVDSISPAHTEPELLKSGPVFLPPSDPSRLCDPKGHKERNCGGDRFIWVRTSTARNCLCVSFLFGFEIMREPFSVLQTAHQTMQSKVTVILYLQLQRQQLQTKWKPVSSEKAWYPFSIRTIFDVTYFVSLQSTNDPSDKIQLKLLAAVANLAPTTE